jgi:hypothetical protein
MNKDHSPQIFDSHDHITEPGLDIKGQTIRYLKGTGNNTSLAAGINFYSQHFRYFDDFELDRLSRIAGPEPHMTYHADRKEWEQTVKLYSEYIKGGDDFPPLIVIDFGIDTNNPHKRLFIADGNKRYEAMSRCGVTTHNVVFCLQSNPRDHNLE